MLFDNNKKRCDFFWGETACNNVRMFDVRFNHFVRRCTNLENKIELEKFHSYGEFYLKLTTQKDMNFSAPSLKSLSQPLPLDGNIFRSRNKSSTSGDQIDEIQYFFFSRSEIKRKR